MQHHFKSMDFLKRADITPEEVGCFVDTAIESLLLRLPGPGREPQAHGEGRALALTTL
jgi:hypothetical protein